MAGSGTDNRQRQETLSARFTDEEAQAVRAKAERAGVSVASLIRAAVLDLPLPDARAPRRSSVDHRAVARLLGQLGTFNGAVNKIGSNINQFTREVNRGRAAQVDALLAEWEEFKSLFDRDMAELRLCCLQALGREPVRDHPANPDRPDQSPPAGA